MTDKKLVFDRKLPQGMGLYIRSLRGRRKSPDQYARFLRDHGMQWMAIGGPWHDVRGGQSIERWINPPDRIKKYTDALAQYEIAVYIWGYPWHDRVELFVDQLAAASNDATTGWLLDPELGLKRHAKDAARLVKLCRQKMPRLTLGMTSYGLPYGHRTFPWEEFAEPGVFDPSLEVDFGSPQLYTMGHDRIVSSMTEYSDLGFDHIAPSFGNYKFVRKDPDKPARGNNRKAVPLTGTELHEHLSGFISSEIPIKALIGWAENFVTNDQWVILDRWADWINRGASRLKPLAI